MAQKRSVYHPQRITVALLRTLDKAPPPPRPREIRDSDAGLILRHQTSGYLGLYANLGRGRRERLCNARLIVDPHSSWTLGKARAEALRMKVAASDGRDFAAERKARAAVPLLGTFVDEIYEPWLLRNRRHGEQTANRIRKRFPGLLKTRLDEITPAKLEPWRTARKNEGVARETINRDVADLRRALTRAVKLEIIARNPLLGFEEERVDRRKQVVRALTSDEKARLIEALEQRDARKREQRASANAWREARGYPPFPAVGRFADQLTPAVITSLETGLRRKELFSLHWSSVDLQQRMLHVEGQNAKTYETRSVPLNDVSYRVLRDWWLQQGQPSGGLVFSGKDGQPTGSLKKSYYPMLAAAGIARVDARGVRVNWHSLRHTFGTLLGAAGVDPTTLMKLMGHAKLETTQRYLHTDEQRKRQAVDLLASARTSGT